MSAYLLPQPQQFFDNNGDPLAGGKVYTCIPGASGYTKAYQKDTYTDATGLVVNPNPVILDSFGRCNIWGDATNYKFFIFSSNDILIDTIDDIPCLLGAGASIIATPADGSVTTPKLADGAVTSIKIADSAVTGTQIADAAVQPAKLSTGHPTWDTGGTLSATAFSGSLTGNVTGNASTATALSTASGSAPSYAARAWVNFNGTGTVAIRASGNVSSITDNGVGDYTANFTTAIIDANYSVAVSASLLDGTVTSGNILSQISRASSALVSSSVRVFCSQASAGTGGALDTAAVTVSVFR